MTDTSTTQMDSSVAVAATERRAWHAPRVIEASEVAGAQNASASNSDSNYSHS